MKWISIYDERPENNSVIVTTEYWYDGFPDSDFKKLYTLGMRIWNVGTTTWQDLCKVYEDLDSRHPEFYWIYAKDFPFPPDKGVR